MIERFIKALWLKSEGQRVSLLFKALYGIIAWPILWLQVILISELNTSRVKLVDALYILQSTVILLVGQVLWMELLFGAIV